MGVCEALEGVKDLPQSACDAACLAAVDLGDDFALALCRALLCHCPGLLPDMLYCVVLCVAFVVSSGVHGGTGL